MKRGESGLSLIVGVKKPVGMTSHDVVNEARRAFGEKRVGHAGTLDPAASGVLPLCVGPATRLADYLGGFSKDYRATIAFGTETDTDDAEGEAIRELPVPDEVADAGFAETFVASLVGEHDQLPPRYSAIKIDGRKSYDLARKGLDVPLESRLVSVHDAQLLDAPRIEGGTVCWDVQFSVSKGTYIRSLARDIGRMLGTAAHLAALERTRVGRIGLADCVSLETLHALKEEVALDPVRVLGYRFAFGDDIARLVENGGQLRSDDVKLYEPLEASEYEEPCACTSTLCPSCQAPRADEVICLIVANTVKALYAYDEHEDLWIPICVFAKGIVRG